MSISSKATGLRPGVCTSTTRPTAPYTGQIIFQTDTGTMHNWDGATWQLLAPTQQRNLLYNGAMQVAQRGTSTAGITGSGYYTADRWAFLPSAMGTWTQTIENDAPTGSGFRKSVKLACTTADASPAAGDFVLFDQYLEGQDVQAIRKGTSSAQQLTLSFWVKSFQTGTFIVELYDNNNSRQISKPYTINASGTWEFETITFPADTTGAFANDNASSLTVRFWLGAGSTYTSGTLNSSAWASPTNANRAVGVTNLASSTNNYWQITGAQLNIGGFAAPFEFKAYGQELRECQRYYYRATLQNAYGPFNCLSQYVDSTTTSNMMLQIPVPMRVSGSANTSIDTSALSTINILAMDAATGTTPSSLTIAGNNGTFGVTLQCNTASAFYTTTKSYMLRGNNSSTAYIGISAEL